MNPLVAPQAATGLTRLSVNVNKVALLRKIGVLPELNVETLTLQPVAAAARYTLHAEAGVVAAADGLRGDAWVALEAALAHGRPAAVRAACAPVAAALRAPLRGLLHYHLGQTRLRTRQVMLDVQKLVEPPTP